MWVIVRQFATYVIFLCLICLLTYFNHNPHSSDQVHHQRRYWLNTRQSNLDLRKIQTIPDYWRWLKTSFVPNLRAQPWYNGAPPQFLSGFVNDRSNRLIGWPIIRQRRIRPAVCADQRLQTVCEDDLHGTNEEMRSFEPGWINETHWKSNRSVERAFAYQSKNDWRSFGNGKRGYMYEFRGRQNDLRSNLSELHRSEWIDQLTRSITIEFSLYNPNTELLIFIHIQTDVSNMGALQSRVRIEPIPFFGKFKSRVHAMDEPFYSFR